MFKRLKLTNFRQHRDLTINFVPGINALRGVNEAGKTTILEAIAYVMFGAKIALREELEKVVTWGEKPGSLKTELDVEVNGVTYLGKRGKSGAEVWLEGGMEPLVTGQNECTKFWETLLGVSARVATNLMLANQAKLRGALEGGSAAPVTLIETLANFKLIDQILAIVIDEVPNGQTRLVEDRIATLKEQIEQPDDTAPAVEFLDAASKVAKLVLEIAVSKRSKAQAACDVHAPAADDAQRAANGYERAQAAFNAAEAQAQAAATAAAITLPAAPDVSRMAELRAQLADAGAFERAKASHTALSALKEPDAEWDEGLPSLERALDKARASLRVHIEAADQLGTQIADKRVLLAQIEGKLIKETQCAFCDKVLSDVPEVVTRNRKLADDIEACKGDLADLQDRLTNEDGAVGDLREEIVALEHVQGEGQRRATIYARHAEYIRLDEKFVPARWSWIGPDITKPPANPATELAGLEAAQRTYDQAKGRKDQADASLRDAAAKRDAAKVALSTAELLANQGKPVLAKAVELAEAYAQANAEYDSAREAYQRAASALETAQAVQREREAAKTRLRADLEREEKALSATVKGNVLVGKLRAARPQIADKLWTVVLHSVSTYFSSIRGAVSVVTRTDNGFQVDGRDIEGLSGSTLDALGLAIRIALVKTFLPNARFMVLDEPAAACDDGRETNMIGLVASVDFDQVILVTHSGLADAFAHQVIQL